MKEKILALPLAVRIIAPVIVVGLCIGLGIGLYVGWMLLPVQITNVDVSDLKGDAQDDYIALTAETFSYDQNLDNARERLKKLKDPNITERVANLAISYAAQRKPESAQIATLAVALGSGKEGIALLAATPEIVAIALSPTLTASPTPNTTPTISATATISITRTPTRRVTATSTRIPASAISPTQFFPPDVQNGWPGGFYVEQANVQPGQQYWHLTKAIFCDIAQTQYGCTDKSGPPVLPGGPSTIGVWVSLVGGKAPLLLDGKEAKLEDKSSDTQCYCTYTLDFPGPTIAVSGKPSDRILGAANSTAIRGGFPNTHVRYFFTYQLVTR